MDVIGRQPVGNSENVRDLLRESPDLDVWDFGV